MFDFVGDAYAARSVNAAVQQAINYYLEKDPEGWRLYGTPGSVTLTTLAAASVVRQSFTYDRVCYFVSGDKFYSMDTANNVTLLGTLSGAVGYVSIVTNGLVILLVDGIDGYTYTIASATFAVIADADFPANPICAAMLDNIFIVINGGSQAFYISTTGTSWAAADFASAESAPDDLIGCIGDHQELILAGADSVEVWYNSGEANFTFSRRSVIENGLAGVGAMCKADNSVFFLDKNGIVQRLNAYTPTPVSTRAVEYEISKMSDVSDCLMWAQWDGGHVFIWCQFPTGNQTWVYDVTAAAAGKSGWHRRAYRDPTTNALNRHRANCYVKFNGMHLVGDHSNGRILKLSQEIFDDNGDPLPSIRVCRHVAGPSQRKTVQHNSLVIIPEAGVGLSTGQGSNPQMMLKWSDDNGQTWGNPVWRSIGAIGKYAHAASWNRLGSVRPPNSRVYWAEITDPVRRVIVNAELDVS